MPMKAAMIAVVLAVLLAVGGIVFQISPVTAASPGGDASDSSHGDDGILKPVCPAFVQLPPMRMPVVHDKRTIQFVELNVMIEVEDTDVAAQYEEKMTYLQDKVFSNLHGRFDVTVGQDGARIDTKLLKRKVAAAAAAVMGRETVKDVLIQNLRQRRI
ncbi:MAG TPA: hypothetical protein DFI00_09490 [Rhodospirillaceae bacterium]|nr:hypothetical protein [Rhodospirillaceae bacterium]